MILMTEATVERRIIRVPPVVAFGSRFGRYKPEEEKEVRKVEVKADRVLEQLIAAWKKLGDGRRYGDALRYVADIDYSAKDVENFSITLAEFQDEERFADKAGYLLSALVNNGKDTEYVIHTHHLSQKIDYLGYANTKNILVDGDAGNFVGQLMKGGKITVNGKAGEGAGMWLAGGAIIVNGNVDCSVGLGMTGGEISINGEIGSIVLVGQGKIYHKGVLIVDK